MRTRAAALLIVVAIVAAACGSSTADVTSDAAAGTEATPLEGEFAALDGDTVNLAEFEGQDVVLWFWAPW